VNYKQITPSTISLFVTTILFFIVGIYTDNSGFQLAGVIMLTVVLITAFNQVRNPNNSH
jgi:hypothetical protein